MKQYDVLILGAGMVGGSIALHLARSGLTVALIDRNNPPHFDPSCGYDVRISAISSQSVNYLQSLDLWQSISTERAHPYRSLATWEFDHNKICFDAQELNLSELGFMVENNLITARIHHKLGEYPHVDFIVTPQIEAQKKGDLWQIGYDNHHICAPLIIGADGAHSKARELAGIGITAWDYRQECMLIIITTLQQEQSQTWQEFHTSGPRAYLPLAGNNACLAWYDSPQKIAMLKKLSKEQLGSEIKKHFPAHLALDRVEKWESFPLKRRHAQSYYHNGIVLAGDAAHTINPLAGQGVNIGFKDAKTLCELLIQARRNNQPLNDEKILEQYQKARYNDNLLMQSAMDFFYKTSKSESKIIQAVRNVAIFTAQRGGFLKREVLKYAVGL